MVTKGRISRFLAMALVVFVIATQAIFLGTAVFAENREEEELTSTKNMITEYNSYASYAKNNSFAEYSGYNEDSLNYLAQEYDIEDEYLYYIMEVEKTFDLEPYELFALISQESKFIPQTKMDGGSFSYSTTQMKLATAKTAYMAITEYYKKEIPYPTHQLLTEDKYYATLLAGGYLKYLHDVYKNKYESYTAYHRGIGGRLEFYKKHGHYKSPYALQIAGQSSAFARGKIKI